MHVSKISTHFLPNCYTQLPFINGGGGDTKFCEVLDNM